MCSKSTFSCYKWQSLMHPCVAISDRFKREQSRIMYLSMDCFNVIISSYYLYIYPFFCRKKFVFGMKKIIYWVTSYLRQKCRLNYLTPTSFLFMVWLFQARFLNQWPWWVLKIDLLYFVGQNFSLFLHGSAGIRCLHSFWLAICHITD